MPSLLIPPENYSYLDLRVVGSIHPEDYVSVLVCDKCGSMVGNTFQHDRFHGPVTVLYDQQGNQVIWTKSNIQITKSGTIIENNSED